MAGSVFMLLAGADVVGAAANTACPAGYETIAVVDAVNEGYVDVAPRVDNSGNRDGVVCRRLVGDGTLHVFGNPNVDHIYNWLDNVTPR
jgi:hypothetical protein